MLQGTSPKAAEAKEKGNQAFKNSDFPEAIGHYTAAILADASDHTLLLNRAAAYLKLGKYQGAERDCNAAIKLNPQIAKAYYRRGQARRGLGQTDDALADFQRASQLQPEDKSCKAEVEAIQLLQREQKKTRTIKDFNSKSSGPTPDSSKVSQFKRRRIPIEIVEPQEKEPFSSFGDIGPPKEGGLLEAVSTRSLAPEGKPSIRTAPSPSNTPDKKASSLPSKNAVPVSPAPVRTGGGIFRSSGEYTLFNGNRQSGTRKQMSSTAKSVAEPRPSPASTQPPVTLFQFTRLWDNNKGNHERWAILKTVPPSAIPQLFKTSMEPAFLISILRVFLSVAGLASERELKEIREYMVALSRAQRFSTIMLLLNKEEKQLVKKVWDSLGDIRQENWNVS